MNGLFTRTKLFVVTADEIAELTGDRITINRGDGVLFVQLRDFFAEALAKFDKRIGNALIDAASLGGIVVALKIDPHGASLIEDLCQSVANVLLVDHFFDIAETVSPVSVVVSGDRPLLRGFFGAVKEEWLSPKLTPDRDAVATIISTEIAAASALTGTVAGHVLLPRLLALTLLSFAGLLALALLTLTLPLLALSEGCLLYTSDAADES